MNPLPFLLHLLSIPEKIFIFSDYVKSKEKLFYRIEVTHLVLQMDTSIIGKEDQASFKSLSKKFLRKKYRKGKNEQNDRQFKKKNMKYYFLFHQVFLQIAIMGGKLSLTLVN